MAVVKPVWHIQADPSQPEAEISNIIVAFLRAHPGKEIAILQAVKGDIEKATTKFEAKAARQGGDTPSGQEHTNE